MPRRIVHTLGGLAVLTLATGPLGAQQLPPASASEAQAGLRVTSATLDPAVIRVTRGDTVTIAAKFFDAAGLPVTNVVAIVVPMGSNLTPLEPPFGSGPFPYLASTPGTTQFIALVRVPEDEGGFQGITGIVQVGSIDAEVLERAAASVEIDEPAYTAYAGTAFKLRGRALTEGGTVHESARLGWRSEDPSVASITPGGVLMPARPGSVTVTASTENGVSAARTITVVDNPARELVIEPNRATSRTGDVVRFDVRALDAAGLRVDNIALTYAIAGLDSTGAQIYDDGAFVAENPGAYTILVSIGPLVASALVEAVARPRATRVETVGRGPVTAVATSDLWVFEGRDGRDYAYTGTHARGGGERMFAWDVTDPENIVLTDSVRVDARVVNDVKVNADASWAIITREGASNRRNGIVVLDLADPAHPTILTELTDDMTAGIHNVWINGDVVYAINDGTAAINIIDMSDPATPRHAGVWDLRPGDPDKSLHDVWSDGQYAYVSYWNDGLVILDVGAGTHGGTPAEPAFVSSISYDQGNTHVAWREGNYVFVGDEIFGCDECNNGPRGYIHVIDVEDIEHPREVARFEVPEAGTHNIWVDEGTLYIAYYQGGLRIVDVSGELRGDLYRQGRQIGWIQTAAEEGEGLVPNSAMAWGPQPHKGYIFVSDMNSGLWAVKHERPARLTP